MNRYRRRSRPQAGKRDRWSGRPAWTPVAQWTRLACPPINTELAEPPSKPPKSAKSCVPA